ncbi:phage tail tape measure protein [Rhodococcus sp. NPDC004095]
MSANKIKIEIDVDNKSAVAEFDETAKSVDRLGAKSNDADAAFAGFARTVGTGALVVGAAVAAGMGVAIHSAGNYESSLSQLRQASGATAKEMDAMSQLARELGQSNDLAGVSAADAARTMVELSKAGLSVKDTMDSSKAVMSLAKAGNIDFAEAAVIAASALNAFGLQGNQAIQVADMLAAGANASQAELGDLALGLQQSATVAKQFKLSLNENVTALALFANNGIKGSDAGTSLKTMLIALASPSVAAAKEMKKMGFSAYDAQGQFVGLEEMSKRLAKATSKMTDEQKQNALATIFGTDAFRAASVLADNAGDSYTKMSKAVGQAGAAQKAAAAQMGPYEKSTEGLRNAMSELGLTIGSKALPYVTRLTNAAGDFVRGVNGAVPGAIATFNQLLPVITQVSAGLVAFTVVQNAAGVSTKALTIAQGALNFVMRANPLALAAAGATAIVVAYVQAVQQTNNNTVAAERLKVAHDNLAAATRNAKAAQDELTGAQRTAEGAALAVERAQVNFNNAVAQYGPSSLEAREAAFQLKGAQDELANANARVADKTRDAQKAQEERTKAVEAVKAASRDVAGTVSNEANAWKTLSTRINEAADARSKGDFKSPVLNLTGNPLNKHATGTAYSPGGRSVVGENGPEIVDMPQGAQVTPAYRTRNELAGGAGNTINVTQHIYNQMDYDRGFAELGFRWRFG